MKRSVRCLASAIVALLALSSCQLPGGSQASEPSTPASSQPPAPTMEDLSSATLDLPVDCAGLVFGEGTSSATFADGVATSASSDYAYVTLDSVESGTFDGTPVALARLSCFPGASISFEALAVYDSSLTLLGSFEQWGSSTSAVLRASVDTPVFSSVTVSGSQVTLEVSDITLWGDTPIQAAPGSGSATETLTWNGAGFDVSSIVYHTPQGDVVSPDQATVQAFYDAVSTSDDATASRYTSAENLTMLDEVCPLSCPSVETSSLRHVQFPAGGTVGTCVLMGADTPSGGWPLLYLQGDGVNGSIPLFSVIHSQPGDFVCGIDTTTATPSAAVNANSAPTGYSVWFTIRATMDPEAFEVIDIGRSF